MSFIKIKLANEPVYLSASDVLYVIKRSRASDTTQPKPHVLIGLAVNNTVGADVCNIKIACDSEDEAERLTQTIGNQIQEDRNRPRRHRSVGIPNPPISGDNETVC